MFYLMTHSTHFIYGYMASDIWLRTILIVRKETCCRHIGYSYLLIARVLLYAPSHRQGNTYHSLCYTSRGALAGTRNRKIILKHARNLLYISSDIAGQAVGHWSAPHAKFWNLLICNRDNASEIQLLSWNMLCTKQNYW